jgi:hypothetical protein
MMISKRTWLTALATLTFILSMLCGYGLRAQEVPVPTATAEAVSVPALPGSATEYQPPTPSPTPTIGGPSINPTATPTVNPTATPTVNPTATPTAMPTVAPSVLPLPGGIPNVPLAPPPAPLPAADPLPTAGEFTDAANRFRVAILQDYRVSPIGDAVLVESPKGALAYTALAQPATAGFVTPDTLAEMAKNAFQRGEGFQTGGTQAIPGGGVQLDWSGNLTIGGMTQPVNGVIIAKPAGTQVLMLLIAATAAGADQVPNAAAALIDSLQAVQ